MTPNELTGNEMLELVVGTGCIIVLILACTIFFHDFKPMKPPEPTNLPPKPDPDYLRLFKVKNKRNTKTYCASHFLKIENKATITRLNDLHCCECTKRKK